MNRRRILAAIFGTGALAVPASARATSVASGAPSVVYSLSDADKAAFVLGNMRNHIEGMGGPDAVHLALVVFGPPVEAFRAAAEDRTVATRLEWLRGAGVQVFTCVNTMRVMHLALADMLPGVAVAERGGVVKLADLQAQGWAYVRP